MPHELRTTKATTRAANRGLVLSPYCVVRPPVKEGDESVLIAHAPRQRRVRMSRSALLDLLQHTFTGRQAPRSLVERIGELGLTDCEEPNGEDSLHMEHWRQRGWHSALEYYLWSRSCRYVDRHDPAKMYRRQALSAYVDADGPPPARLMPGESPLSLPEPEALPSGVALGQLLMQRRTIRKYEPRPVSASVCSGVLWHGLQRVRRCWQQQTLEDPLTFLQSYGVALDPYIVIYSVDGLESGVYYYDLLQHGLVMLHVGLLREEMTGHLCGQRAPESAAWTVILVADFAQYQWRYRHDRALRNLFLDAGRVAQELLLVAGAYGLGSFVTPATRDQEVSHLLRLDCRCQAPLHTLTMGWDPRTACR